MHCKYTFKFFSIQENPLYLSDFRSILNNDNETQIFTFALYKRKFYTHTHNTHLHTCGILQ